MPARVPMTAAQREALLALPDAEELLVRHHGLDERDLAAVNTARTPETRLGYAPAMLPALSRAGISVAANCCPGRCSAISPSNSTSTRP